jgi:alkanesulfonate monooxygenase SsuD/methylene tetrahydromethanopterin reductase-like flavin-dependent oxidoreductase (luciferase family)
MVTGTEHVHLGVALDGAGWHPAAWREPDARPADLFTAGYWVDLVAVAERGLLDLVTFEDALTMQSADRFAVDDRTDQVRGRLDAVLVAARVAPTTRHIGLMPVVTTTHTEPFHVSKAIATLDWVSGGRGGVQVRVGGTGAEPALFGRREPTIRGMADLADPERLRLLQDGFDEAADHVEVMRRLWDSWEDDAEIRDAATGRFVDRERLHYIDFRGRWFSVRGPSITPRPPQGQPVVAAGGYGPAAYQLAARQTDLLFVSPGDATLAEVRAVVAEDGGEPPIVLADLIVFIDPAPGAAAARRDRLDALDPYAPDARVVAGTASDIADEIEQLRAAGYAGVHLRPAALPHDLLGIADTLVPELQRRDLFRDHYPDETLRARLGLPHPANRYATGRPA